MPLAGRQQEVGDFVRIWVCELAAAATPAGQARQNTASHGKSTSWKGKLACRRIKIAGTRRDGLHVTSPPPTPVMSLKEGRRRPVDPIGTPTRRVVFVDSPLLTEGIEKSVALVRLRARHQRLRSSCRLAGSTYHHNNGACPWVYLCCSCYFCKQEKPGPAGSRTVDASTQTAARPARHATDTHARCSTKRRPAVVPITHHVFGGAMRGPTTLPRACLWASPRHHPSSTRVIPPREQEDASLTACGPVLLVWAKLDVYLRVGPGSPGLRHFT
ncbi:hypothetical protein HU200_006839 [Digitaria exilis]|uniref:Uncharacterized protein n=1 Tax=Digitaria exilis TaxID=1010633 RepID=A0A835KRU5_9POAL|nr:hypothetical protein HU200_006839 [Digitaria exilis]